MSFKGSNLPGGFKLPQPIPANTSSTPSITSPPSSTAITSSSSSSSQPATSAESSSSGLDYAVGILKENWKIALAVALISAAAAGSIYWATSSSSSSSSSAAASAAPKEKKGEKKGVKKSEKKAEEKKEAKEEPKEQKTIEKNAEEEKDQPKTKQERFDEAKRLKERGNKYYSGKNFEKAIELYSEALEMAPDSPEAAVFYSNRAACYSNLDQHDKVIEDCTKALEIDKKYVKALNRRAGAYEAQNKLRDSLVDYTAACILDGFQTESTLRSADKIIKSLGAISAAEYFPSRKIALPANYFLAAYFDSFRNRFELKINTPANEGDETYLKVVEKLKEKEFTTALEITNQALEQQTTFQAQALNLRGTLKYLMGDFDDSIADLTKSLELTPTPNTLIKRASVYFEKKENESSFKDFERAIELDGEDPDIYYHRGQAHFLIGDLDSALKDYQKSIALDSNVPFVLVQLAVIYFRIQSIQNSLKTFEEALAKFPQYGDLYNYYGEVLTELQKFEEAEKNFEKAIELNPGNPLSYINKAFLIARWKEDLPTAIQILHKAIEIDPKCEVAYAHLGQLLIQQNKLDEAIESYQKAVESSRTEVEIAQWFSCIEASKAQKKVLEVYPEIKQAAGLGGPR